MIVYISIGNSDDKLTQQQWALFYSRTCQAISGNRLHGVWLSSSESAYQNACWCVEIDTERVEHIKARLKEVARDFSQDSITWAVAETEFLSGATQ